MEIVFSQAGPWGLVVVVLGALVSGRLVPRSALRDRERLVDLYKEAFEHERKARERSDKQVEEMLEYGRTANHVLASLPAASAAEGGRDATVA